MTTATELAPPIGSQTYLQWKAVEWILAFGPLSPSNVMEYFSISPFFDPLSNNMTIRMQKQFFKNGMEGVNEAEELKRMVGIEFRLQSYTEPGLFIIEKANRTSPEQATTVALYYILNDSVYQSPSVYTVVNERILTATIGLTKSLDTLLSRAPQFTPTDRYRWKIQSTIGNTNSTTTETNTDPTTDSEQLEINTESLKQTAFDENREGRNPLLESAFTDVLSTFMKEYPPVIPIQEPPPQDPSEEAVATEPVAEKI